MAADESSDLRFFIREMTARLERAIEVMDRKTDAIVVEVRNQRTDFRREFRDLHARLRDIHVELLAQREDMRRSFEDVQAENRAQREALFRILDRLDDGGAAPAAG